MLNRSKQPHALHTRDNAHPTNASSQNTPEGLEAVLCGVVVKGGIVVCMIADILVGGPVTVESCRAILVEASENQVSGDYVATFSNLSEKEKFDIAKQLLPEIKAYNDKFSMKPRVSSNKAALNSSLLKCFQHYDGIPYKDFFRFFSSPNTYGIAFYLIRNKSFPITLFLDPNLLESYRAVPNFWVLEDYVRIVKVDRSAEIITYCRGLVPGSESMSDEMVLSVAGVQL